jgi:hypothetical protein
MFQVIVMLINLHAYLEARPANSFAKDYAKNMAKELDKRFPGNGMDQDLYAFGHILHPFYRGSLFRKGSEKWKAK